MQRPRLILTACALSVVLLVGCASEKSKDDTLAAGQLYQQIQANITAGNYKTAVERLRTLQSRFPFDTFGTQAELDLIYTSYLNQDYDGAEDAADRFIREHPRHPDVDYAFYMKGVAYFDPGVSLLQGWFKHDNFQRDPTNAQKSFEAFRTLLQRYPDSKYAADARQRMIFLRERLADFDWIVADWYVRRGAWISALQRADNIVRHYPQTPRVEDALQIMITAYTELGMPALAEDSRKVLEKNFPGARPEYTPRGPV